LEADAHATAFKNAVLKWLKAAELPGGNPKFKELEGFFFLNSKDRVKKLSRDADRRIALFMFAEEFKDM